MAAVATMFFTPITKLIPTIPSSDFSELVAQGFAMAHSEPAILEMIDRNRDVYALEKKRVRLEDKAWEAAQGSILPGFDLTEDEKWMEQLSLLVGRERMPAVLVLIFLLIRGYLGGFKDRKTTMMLAESRTMDIVIVSLGQRMPGASTILENVNAVTGATREAIHDAQIRQVLREELDDFDKLTCDSTSVQANSAWPTDSGTIMGLSIRAEHLIRCLGDHGIVIRLPAVVQKHLTEIKEINKVIQLSAGKKDSAKKRRKSYRKMMKIARRLRKYLGEANDRAIEKNQVLDIVPSHKSYIVGILKCLEADIHNLGIAITNADKRINREEKIPVDQKILSLSDDDAAMIVKGTRDPVLGYKPQIGRSENGFVTAIIVPAGNASDAGQLRPIVEKSLKRTGIMPSVLNFDDGYTNTADREYYLDRGIEVVSFSGSKGKKITPADEYESKAYREARNDRSAVESLMFTLKHNNDLDQMMRRGLDNVRSELLEKVIVYNFFRMTHLRRKRCGLNAA